MADDKELDPAMRGKLLSRPVGARIAALADAQHGVVTRRQLLALDLHPHAIDRRIDAGGLHILFVASTRSETTRFLPVAL